MAKVLESEVWCPSCKTLYGRIFNQEIREHVFKHVTEPKKLPKYCSKCEVVITRK